jgi:AcrR family transcriptional regulator
MARVYIQTARAEATERTRKAILDAAIIRFRRGEFETNLEAIADQAGVTMRTILRHFGSKEGLVEAAIAAADAVVRAERRAPAGDAEAFSRALISHYERQGDRVLQMLAAEDRYPLVREATESGRRAHAEMVEECFAADLEGLDRTARAERLALLVAVTDVYTWALLRRRCGLGRKATEAAICGLINHARGDRP